MNVDGIWKLKDESRKGPFSQEIKDLHSSFDPWRLAICYMFLTLEMRPATQFPEVGPQ